VLAWRVSSSPLSEELAAVSLLAWEGGSACCSSSFCCCVGGALMTGRRVVGCGREVAEATQVARPAARSMAPAPLKTKTRPWLTATFRPSCWPGLQLGAQWIS